MHQNDPILICLLRDPVRYTLHITVASVQRIDDPQYLDYIQFILKALGSIRRPHIFTVMAALKVVDKLLEEGYMFVTLEEILYE